MDYIAIRNTKLSEKESNFIGQIGADLLIKSGKAPNNEDIFHEIIFRAMLVKGIDVPKH